MTEVAEQSENAQVPGGVQGDNTSNGAGDPVAQISHTLAPRRKGRKVPGRRRFERLMEKTKVKLALLAAIMVSLGAITGAFGNAYDWIGSFFPAEVQITNLSCGRLETGWRFTNKDEKKAEISDPNLEKSNSGIKGPWKPTALEKLDVYPMDLDPVQPLNLLFVPPEAQSFFTDNDRMSGGNKCVLKMSVKVAGYVNWLDERKEQTCDCEF